MRWLRHGRTDEEGRLLFSNAPTYGDLGTYSEPVLQRRLMIVTDDYIVLADYLRGNQPYVYDNLFQLRGATLGNAAAKQFLARDPKLNTDPLGSGQFIAGGDRYRVKALFTIESHHFFSEKGKDGHNVPHKNWESDGRIHQITIGRLDGDGNKLSVTVEELKNGQVTRQESTHE